MTRTTAAIAIAIIAALAGYASAQNYPLRPVHLVVPNAPGGATDILSRLLADRLAPRLGQQVVIDNKPGAGGNVAARFVAKASGDGYTVLFTTRGIATAPALSKDAGFDPIKEFLPVALLAVQGMLLVVHPSLPAANVADFVAYARAHPGQLTYATPGIGTPHHLAMEMFKQIARVNLTHVPYKGGAPAVQDVVAGRVPVMFASYVIAGPYMKAGKLRALGASGDARNSQAQDIPTISEQGYPGFDVEPWFGITAPLETPPAAIARLNQEINTVLANTELKQQLLKIGFDPVPAKTPAEFGDFMRTEAVKWSKVIREANITPE